MAFSASDLANIESAIVALATGSRAARVTIGDKTIQYSETDIAKLQSLRAMIQAEVGTTIPRAYARNGGRAKI